jgi:Transposase DDE domain group 1
VSDDSTTQCLLFPGIFRKPVVAQFDQREGSSDGGAVLLKAADRHYGLVDELTACLRDPRQASKVDHSLRDLVAQRVFSIACGYADANDSARLASDPIHKLLLERDPVEGLDLASQPTLSRFENAVEGNCIVWARHWPGAWSDATPSDCGTGHTGSPSIWIPPMILRMAHSNSPSLMGIMTTGAIYR